MNTEHETTEDYYTRGLVAGHRRIFFLTEEAARRSLVTAEDMILFYGEMNMDRLEAYYTGIRDILGEYFDELAKRDFAELEDDEDLGIRGWERTLSAVNLGYLAAAAMAIVTVLLYWKGPEF